MQHPVLQHPQDLTLTLWQGAPTISLHRLVAEQITLGEWEIQFEIIGESHAVTFARAGCVIGAEVFACVPVPSGFRGRSVPYSALRRESITAQGYRFGMSTCQRCLAWPQAEYTRQLAWEFPAVNGETPVTALFWGIFYNSLYWWSQHTYPLETGITRVYTQSFFDFTKGESAWLALF